MSKTVVTYRGHRVSCFGDWSKYSYALVVGEWKDGSEIKDIWDGSDYPEDKPAPKSWTEVVHHLVDWAEKWGHTIHELSVAQHD